MNINEICKMKRPEDMPLGKNEVVFNHLDYREDKETGDVTGIFVHVEGFRALFLPFFDNGQNFQLDLLLDQLGCESYDPDEINKFKGTVIIAHRYEREVKGETYTNVSFNPKYAEESFA